LALTRRDFLLSAAAAPLLRDWFAGAAPVFSRGFARSSPLAPGVFATIADPSKGLQCYSNGGVIAGRDATLIVEGHYEAAGAELELEIARTVSKAPLLGVVNTHYHLDHTGGNAVFAEAGATILAHRNVRAWLRSENLKFFGPNPKPEDKARVESLVLPDEVYSDAVDIYLGSRQIQVRYMLGHTGGDSVVIVPDANVLYGGDLIWQKHLPNLIDATTSDWVKTLEKLLADHPSATFVSGHGDVASPDDVRDFHDYLVALRDDMAKAQAAGKSGQELTDTVSAQLKDKYGQWGFSRFMPRNIEQTAAELAGTKKVPVVANSAPN